MKRMLVMGAVGGIGQAVADIADKPFGWQVVRADMNLPGKGTWFNAFDPSSIVALFNNNEPFDSVVYAAGLNKETPIHSLGLRRANEDMMRVNFEAPLVALQAWVRSSHDHTAKVPQHFVVVSSNSAHVARSKSIGYCASKAAISMGIRCAARELAKDPEFPEYAPTVWAVEPGWVEGTGMSNSVIKRMAVDQAHHRIPGNRTLYPSDVAHFIVGNIHMDNRFLNGCTLRTDGGEQ